MTPDELRRVAEEMSRKHRRWQSLRAVIVVAFLFMFAAAMVALRMWIMANDT